MIPPQISLQLLFFGNEAVRAGWIETMFCYMPF